MGSYALFFLMLSAFLGMTLLCVKPLGARSRSHRMRARNADSKRSSRLVIAIALSRIHFIPRHWANSNFAAENGKLRAGTLAPRLRSRAILWSGDFSADELQCASEMRHRDWRRVRRTCLGSRLMSRPARPEIS